MTQVEGQETKAEGQAPEQLDEVKELKASKERILEESKGYKSKYQEAIKRLETLEREKLEKEGTQEEKLQKKIEENQKLLDSLSQIKTKALKANVISALSKHANDAYSIDDLLSLKQASMIEYDEETLEPVSESVQGFISKLREEKPYLFGAKKVAPMADGKPASENGKKSISSMNHNEKINLMKESFNKLL